MCRICVGNEAHDPDRRIDQNCALIDARRHLDWDGCFNVRDLGGLPVADRRATTWQALVGADSVHRLSAAGWDSLWSYGVRTIIDLRNEDELAPDLAPRPTGLATIHMPHDGVENVAFWEHWSRQAPPLYYGSHLERFPERSAAVIAAAARSQPGGVLFHCVSGRDRTGMIAMLILALLGVSPEEIADEYELSTARLAPFYAQAGEDDQGGAIDELLAREGTSARETILSTLAAVDIEALLLEGGLTDDDLAALRTRALQPTSQPGLSRERREA
jgi:protein-tyrosine phosphatase